MKKAELELLAEDREYTKIPKGHFCYTMLGPMKDGKLPIRKCPYWYAAEDAPEQMYGYCSYLRLGDWMEEGTMLLWDQVKQCGENIEDEDTLCELDPV